MKRLVLLCLSGVVLLGLPAALGAAEPSAPRAVVAPSIASTASDEVPPDCALRTEVVFWTGGDNLRLARALAANKSPCAEYWMTIPAVPTNKRTLRASQSNAVRALGIHPVAEVTLGEDTGWADWVNEPGANRTWFDAGVEFRREMERAGYDVTKGETWLINEFDRSTARDAQREQPDHDSPPYRRSDMRELMRGLYDGAPGMPPAPGIAEIGIHFRHQNIPDVDRYRLDMQVWFEDAAFWADADRYLRWIAVESYADSRLWAPPGSSLQSRSAHLQAYIFHLLDLLRSGPRTAQTARSFFERKFLPLANSGWRARGGDAYDFVTGHGNTFIDDVQMRQFVSEQVYAIRDYAGDHRHRAPEGRLGFSWQPCNRQTVSDPSCPSIGADAAFAQSLNLITARMAEAIRYAYADGRTTATAACAPPGDGSVDWCRGSLAGAAFTQAWDGFRWTGDSDAGRRSVDAVAFSPDGQTLAAASNTRPEAPGIVRLWNVRTHRQTGRLLARSGAINEIAFGPDQRLIVTGGADGTVRLWDIRTGKQIGSPLRGHAGAVWSVAVSPDGRSVASAADDGTARLWSVRSHEQIGAAIQVDDGYDVAFSADGRILITAGFDAQRWDVRTHRRLGQPACHSRFGLAGVALSADGRMLACARSPDTPGDPRSALVLWNMRTRHSVPLSGHKDSPISVAFSPDGRLLASGGGVQDGTVRLWDVRTHSQTGVPLRGHADAVASVAFSPDGQTLASGGWDGTVRLWNVRTHRQLVQPLSG